MGKLVGLVIHIWRKLLGLVIYDVEVAWGWTVVILLLGGDTTAIIQCMKDTRKT